MINTLYTCIGKMKKKNKKFWNITYKMCKVLINIFYPIIHFMDKTIRNR